MPTAEQVAKWADDFEERYPEALPDRLRWFSDNLGIDQDRLLRLVGLPPAEVKDLREGGCVDWRWVAQEHGDGAEWAEEMLLRAVAFFNYNWEGLRDYLHQSLRAAYKIGRPDGVVSLTELTPAEQDKALLTLVSEGTERSVPVLLVFLSPTPRGPRPRREPRR